MYPFDSSLSLRSESAVTDFPEPDSPTSASISFFWMENEIFSTADMTKSLVRKVAKTTR